MTTLAPRRPGWICALGWRVAVAAGILLVAGLLAAALVRVAPGFGMDERRLDVRLTSASLEAIERQAGGQSNVLLYYGRYLRQLLRGDLGNSLSLGRPVRELLAERLAVSFRSGLTGLLLAWMAALAVVAGLELVRRGLTRSVAGVAASLATGALLCAPAAVIALACAYIEAAPAMAIAAIVFPRVFCYLRDMAGQARGADHVIAAHALGLGPWRILIAHVIAPIAPELLALAGVSVSMAVGAAIPVEALCDSPGVGQLVWQAALARDLPVLVNVTLLITALTVMANLMADTARFAREAEA